MYSVTCAPKRDTAPESVYRGEARSTHSKSWRIGKLLCLNRLRQGNRQSRARWHKGKQNKRWLYRADASVEESAAKRRSRWDLVYRQRGVRAYYLPQDQIPTERPWQRHRTWWWSRVPCSTRRNSASETLTKRKLVRGKDPKCTVRTEYGEESVRLMKEDEVVAVEVKQDNLIYRMFLEVVTGKKQEANAATANLKTWHKEWGIWIASRCNNCSQAKE